MRQKPNPDPDPDPLTPNPNPLPSPKPPILNPPRYLCTVDGPEGF